MLIYSRAAVCCTEALSPWLHCLPGLKAKLAAPLPMKHEPRERACTISGAFCSSSNHSLRSPFSHLGQFLCLRVSQCGFLQVAFSHQGSFMMLL